jgi:hypothetical protein
MVTRQVLQFHGRDRALFNKVNRALVSLKNRNGKIPTAGILNDAQLTMVNALIVQMNTLLTNKVTA